MSEISIYALKDIVPKNLFGALEKIEECRRNGGKSEDGWFTSDAWCLLSSEINCAEVNDQIDHKTANYLREQFL